MPSFINFGARRQCISRQVAEGRIESPYLIFVVQDSHCRSWRLSVTVKYRLGQGRYRPTVCRMLLNARLNTSCLEGSQEEYEGDREEHPMNEPYRTTPGLLGARCRGRWSIRARRCIRRISRAVSDKVNVSFYKTNVSCRSRSVHFICNQQHRYGSLKN